MNAPLNLSRRLAAVVAVTALGLGAAACSSSSDTKGSAASGSSKTAAGSTASKDKATAGSSGAGTSTSGSHVSGTGASGGKTSTTGAGSSKGATGGGSGSSRCRTTGLKAAFATGGDAVPDMKSETQTQASVAFTNIGSQTCTLSGFPGVDMVGNQADDGTWSLSRSSKPVTAISLSPGATTDFTIALGATTQKGSGTFEPGLVRITPPNEKTPFSLKWPFGGAVTQQDGATHPATFVNPIGS